MSEYTTDEFTGDVKVTISEKEVRVWVCDEKGCQFRFKAMGKVIKSDGMDIMIVAEEEADKWFGPSDMAKRLKIKAIKQGKAAIAQAEK